MGYFLKNSIPLYKYSSAFLITEDMGLNYRENYIPFVCITCILSFYIIFKYIKPSSTKISAEYEELIDKYPDNKELFYNLENLNYLAFWSCLLFFKLAKAVRSVTWFLCRARTSKFVRPVNGARLLMWFPERSSSFDRFKSPSADTS